MSGADKIGFILVLGTLLATLFAFAFPRLPRREWQFLAAVPVERSGRSTGWRAINLTFYGVLVASANTAAAALFIVLAASAGASGWSVFLLAGLTFALCLPGAKIVARLVEGKKNTFTVGGASFVGLLALPGVALLTRSLTGDRAISVLATLGAVTVSFALGEALGRLACISFGCCYGRPISSFGPLGQYLLRPLAQVFTGETKKIAYEGGLEGEPVAPVQAMTCLVYSAAALAGAALFLDGSYGFAALLSLVVTQVWRFFSETLRSDYRGGGRISSYQIMSLLGLVYAAVLIWVLPAESGALPDVGRGVAALWSPETLLTLQGLWALVFLYMGRSAVTTGTVTFSVVREKV